MNDHTPFQPTIRWLDWAREIQALAQTDNHYAKDHFQQDRDQRLLEIAAEIISEHSDMEYSKLTRLFREQTGYATPRIDVRAAVFRGEQILLVRERIDEGWTLPGGWADVGDLPSEAVEREVWEEAGFQVKARRVVGVYDANRVDPLQLFHAYKIVFLCEIEGGEARKSSETSEVAFFSVNDLPAPFSSERTHPRHIIDSFKALNNPYTPAVFD